MLPNQPSFRSASPVFSVRHLPDPFHRYHAAEATKPRDLHIALGSIIAACAGSPGQVIDCRPSVDWDARYIAFRNAQEEGLIFDNQTLSACSFEALSRLEPLFLVRRGYAEERLYSALIGQVLQKATFDGSPIDDRFWAVYGRTIRERQDWSSQKKLAHVLSAARQGKIVTAKRDTYVVMDLLRRHVQEYRATATDEELLRPESKDFLFASVGPHILRLFILREGKQRFEEFDEERRVALNVQIKQGVKIRVLKWDEERPPPNFGITATSQWVVCHRPESTRSNSIFLPSTPQKENSTVCGCEAKRYLRSSFSRMHLMRILSLSKSTAEAFRSLNLDFTAIEPAELQAELISSSDPAIVVAELSQINNRLADCIEMGCAAGISVGIVPYDPRYTESFGRLLASSVGVRESAATVGLYSSRGLDLDFRELSFPFAGKIVKMKRKSEAEGMVTSPDDAALQITRHDFTSLAVVTEGRQSYCLMGMGCLHPTISAPELGRLSPRDIRARHWLLQSCHSPFMWPELGSYLTLPLSIALTGGAESVICSTHVQTYIPDLLNAYLDRRRGDYRWETSFAR